MERLAVARQPDLSWDKANQRFAINWRIPKGLEWALSREVCDRLSPDCRWYRDRLPKSTSPAQAAVIKAQRLVEYHWIIGGAREILASPEDRTEIVARLADKAAALMLAQGDRLTAIKAGMAKAHAQAEAVRVVASMPGVTMAAPAGVKVVKAQEVIGQWLAVRAKDRDPPGAQAIQARRSHLARLFMFVAGVEAPKRLKDDVIDSWLERGNLAGITESDIRRYRSTLVKAGGRREYDAMSHLLPMFSLAREYAILTTPNPMAEMKLPAHFSGDRGTTTEAETRALLLAARAGITAGNKMLFAIPLAGFHGAGNKEIFGSAVAEFFPIPAGLFAGTWVWDMRHRRMKDSKHGAGSGFRNRLVPLRKKLITEWGFGDYLASRAGKSLFDLPSDDKFTNVINAWIAETLKAAGFKPMKVEEDGTERWKTFYCLRHRMHNKVPDNAVGRYCTGHGAKDIHEKYIKIDPIELPEDYQAVIDAVEGVPDPTL